MLKATAEIFPDTPTIKNWIDDVVASLQSCKIKPIQKLEIAPLFNPIVPIVAALNNFPSKIHGVYAIFLSEPIDGFYWVYVGSVYGKNKGLRERLVEHIRQLRSGTNSCGRLQEFYDTHGEKEFAATVLVQMQHSLRTDILKAESACMYSYREMKNVKVLNLGDPFGSELTEEVRAAMRANGRRNGLKNRHKVTGFALLTSEQRSEIFRKATAHLTHEQRQENSRNGSTFLQRSERGRKGGAARAAALTPEQRSEAAHKATAGLTFEQRQRNSRKANEVQIAKRRAPL